MDKVGDTVDFLLTAKRDKAAARRFLQRAINLHGLPVKITIDKSGANTAAIHSVNEDACLDIELRQCKYRNNIVEQDHRAVKRITNPMLGFKSFWSARSGVARRCTPESRPRTWSRRGSCTAPVDKLCLQLTSSTAWLSDLEVPSSHFYASCTLLRQNQAAPGSGVRMHGLPRRIHLRHQDAAAFRLGNEQMAILRAAKRHIGRHVFFAGIDSKDRHAQG